MRQWVLVFTLLFSFGAMAQGNTLQYGQAVNVTISGEAPSATYNFNGNAGDYIRVEVISASLGLNPTLNILGPSGSPLATNNDTLAGYGAADAGASLILPESGLYLMVIGRTSDSLPDGSLLVRLNGTPTTSQPLNGQVSATLDAISAPVQVYSFSGGSVAFSSAPGSSYTADLIDSSGQVMTRVDGALVNSASFQLPDPAATYQLVLSTNSPQPVTVNVSTSGAAAPPQAAPAPAQSDPTGACVAVAQGSGLNIRSGPGLEYSVVTALASGQTATITGTYLGWYQVNANGVSGWAAASVVATQGGCSALPAAVPPAAPAPTTAPPTATGEATEAPTEEATTTEAPTEEATTTEAPTEEAVTEEPITDPAMTEEAMMPAEPAEDEGVQVAQDDGGDPYSLQIQQGETRSVSGSVSTPEGDRLDRVSYSAPVGANVRLTISCSGTNVANTRFAITRQDNQSVQYGCGGVYEYTANVAAAASGNIQIEAISNPSYVEWTISGEGF